VKPLRHLSGLWLGEAAPHPSLLDAVPTNPIKWTLTLLAPEPDLALSAFGAGFFDDAADVPGEPVLLFTLSGKVDAPGKGGEASVSRVPVDGGIVTLVKRYTHPDLVYSVINYAGRLSREADGAFALRGTWRNEAENTHGSFACRREED